MFLKCWTGNKSDAQCEAAAKERMSPKNPRALLLLILVGLVTPSHVFAGNSGRETYGDVGKYAIPGVAAVISLWRDENPDYEGIIQLGASTLLTVGTVQGLKRIVDRERPNGENHSFPSGHAAWAFSGASYLHYRYGWQYGTPAYLAASVVAYSRIEADKHFVGDVVAGADIANLMNFFLVDSFNDEVVIIPVFNTHKLDFGILAKFIF